MSLNRDLELDLNPDRQGNRDSTIGQPLIPYTLGLLRRLFWGSVLGSLVWLPTWPVHAHETEVEGNIAATWHIEPDDNPVAGKPAQVRIILTQAGGKIIPLTDCNCTLKIWTSPKGQEPLLTPSLKAIDAEQHTNIPSADVVFPTRGQYELELIGTPKAGATFNPFNFKNTVLIATGTAPTLSPKVSPAATTSAAIGSPSATPVPPTSAPQPISQPENTPPQRNLLGGLALGIGLGAIGVWAWQKRQKDTGD